MAQEDGFVHIPWRANKLTMLLKVGYPSIDRSPFPFDAKSELCI